MLIKIRVFHISRQNSPKFYIYQVHTTAKQRSGMAKVARAKRGDATRGQDKMRAQSQRSKFNEPSRKIDGILEARETNDRKSRI